jgi:hypothetical protein
MARDSDNLARSFETEEAGGLMTGFLAEEDQFDRRSLWRLGSWGVGAVGAVVVAVLAHQSSIGLRHEQFANADLARQAQQFQLIAKQSQNETRRLASAIDTLNGDRDRLYSRITVLEQGLDSVTGSIARQNAAAGSPQATPQPSSIASSSIAPSSPVSSSTLPSSPVTPSTTNSAGPPSSAPSASATSSAPGSLWPASPAKAEPPGTQSAAPTVAPVATAAAAKDAAMPDKSSVAASDPVSVTAAPAARPMASNAPAATPATPLMPAKSIMAPPDAAAGKLMAPDTPPETAVAAPGPEVLAATTSSDDADAKGDDTKADDAAAASTVKRTEFAVDVGTANSVGGLRALWRGLLKSKSNAALAALRPIIVVKEGNNGLGMQLRLVAGPLSDAAAAAKICAAMLEGKRATCETAVFDGQQLALKDDEPPAAAKPVPVRPAVHRRSIARRVMVVEPPKPQPTTLSSFFSR